MLALRRLGARFGTVGRREWQGKAISLAFLILLLTCAWLSLVFSASIGHGRWRGHDPRQHWRRPPPLSTNWSDWVSKDGHPGRSDGGLIISGNLSLSNIVFGIAGSAQLWPKRKEVVRLWWRRKQMQGFVWLEEDLGVQDVQEEDEDLPPVMVSEDTSNFRFTNAVGHPTGIRISRILLETFRLRLPNVQWFVMCDDDTFFSVENLVRVLSKYDSSKLYYIGTNSESHGQNILFSRKMAYGGGGFAISYALAQALVEMQDQCLERYPDLSGSDDRLHACVSELGVPLTKEPGFHQCDIYGNAIGLLAAHPIAPFVSLHHLEVLDPLFPSLGALEGLQLFSKAMRTEPGGFLQQTICYDKKQGLSFSTSLGYVVQVYPEILYPRVLERSEITFKAWNKKKGSYEFDLDTRSPKWICKQPYLFYMEDIYYNHENSSVISTYKRDKGLDEKKKYCWTRALPPEKVQKIQVTSKPLTMDWYQVPRRQCSRITGLKDKLLTMSVGPCENGEVIVSD